MGRGDTDAELFCRLQRPLLEPHVPRGVRRPEELPESGANRGRGDCVANGLYFLFDKIRRKNYECK